MCVCDVCMSVCMCDGWWWCVCVDVCVCVCVCMCDGWCVCVCVDVCMCV